VQPSPGRLLADCQGPDGKVLADEPMIAIMDSKREAIGYMAAIERPASSQVLFSLSKGTE